MDTKILALVQWVNIQLEYKRHKSIADKKKKLKQHTTEKYIYSDLRVFGELLLRAKSQHES
jgi:hypothetical protein